MERARLASLLLIGFLTVAALLWASVFGYVALLFALARRRRSVLFGRSAPPLADGELPSIALVLPVRNEEAYIAAKLADLRRTDYPADKLFTLVVDGGSTDATAALVEAERARGAAIELVRVDDARGKSDQLNAVLSGLRQQIIVVTDADGKLEPGCIRALVETLVADPTTAVVGARVLPATRLLEERIHWWVLNSLWWLEGEALGSGQVSGVCYAVRSSAFASLPSDCTAEDIHLALLASARGLDVRLCRHAVAHELRVPQTVHEFIRFRRRRGDGYVRELKRVRPPAAPLRWHLMRWLRLYHFFVMPVLAGAMGITGLALCATPHWHWAAAVGVAFAIPALAALSASDTLGSDGRRWWHLSLAAGRLAGLTWLSLLVLPRAELPHLIQGD
jgi:cellulose synthase/poly-beta-1,6-N-acetylglucosamine synthase-like glycosyltransferase